MTVQKRKLFDELKHGIEDIDAHNNGKITLRTHKVLKKAKPQVDALFIPKTREKTHKKNESEVKHALMMKQQH